MPDLPISGKIEAKIEGRSVDKLIDAVVDTFSPATEFAGLLGDAVRLARVEVAANITKRAKKIAKDHGIKLTAPPLKFLVPFYEKSSLEEELSLHDLWAELLVSASSGENVNTNRYIGIISELSSEHLLALEKVVGICHSNNELQRISGNLYDASFSYVVDRIKKIGRESSNEDELFERLLFEYERSGILIVYVALTTPDGFQHARFNGENYKEDDELIYETLVSLGLLDKVDTGFVPTHSYDINVKYYLVSALGLDFYRATHSFPAN